MQLSDSYFKKPFIWITVGLTVFILGLFCIDQGHEWGDDFALYIAQSKVLIHGDVAALFEQNQWSMLHSESSLGPYLYPWGFPVLMSPAIAFFGDSFFALKIWNWGIFVALFFAFYRWLKRRSNAGWFSLNGAFLIFIFAFLHPKIIENADRLVSDLFFTGLVLLFFYVLYDCRHNWLRNVLLIAILYAAAETRINGLFLIPVYVVFHWRNGISNQSVKKWVEILIPIFAFFILYLITKTLTPNGEANHWDIIQSINYKSLISNAWYYFLLIGKYPFIHIATFLGPVLGASLAILSWFFIALGVAKFSRKTLPVLVWILGNVAIYIVWPSQQGVRFIYPIMPFVLLYFVLGIYGLLEYFRQNKMIPLVSTVFVVLAIIQSIATTNYYFKKDTNLALSKEAKAMYYFMKQHASPKDVVAFDKPRAFRLFTGLNAIRTDTDSFYKKSAAKYLIINKQLFNQKLNNTQFIVDQKKVYENSEFVIYQKLLN